jgi:hypothetical protein
MAKQVPVKSLTDAIVVLVEDYGRAFHHCCQELWSLSSRWDRYEALFGSQERVDLLNKTSGQFWYDMQGILHEHILLSLCRLTDRTTSMGKRNLSVSLIAELEPSTNKKRLLQRTQIANESTKFARSWRDKRIAHNDFGQITCMANEITPSTRAKIEKSILAIHDVLRWVQGKHFSGDMNLHDLGSSDASALMRLLDDGLKYREIDTSPMHDSTVIQFIERKYPWQGTGDLAESRYTSRRPKKPPRYRYCV